MKNVKTAEPHLVFKKCSGRSVKMAVDCAAVTVMDAKCWEKIGKPKLQPPQNRQNWKQ